MTPAVVNKSAGFSRFSAEPTRTTAHQKARRMDNPPENLSELETNRSLANEEATSVQDADDFAERLKAFQAETRRRREYGSSLRGYISVIIALAIARLYFGFMFGYTSVTTFVCFIIGAVILFTYVARYRTLVSGPNAVTIRLTENCGPQAISALLTRLHARPSRKEKQLIWQTITSVMQRISSDEAEALPRDIRDRFNRRLHQIAQSNRNTPEQVEFCIAWLKVLQEIGTSRDYRLIKYLSVVWMGSTILYPVREAAQECLLHIEARTAAEQPGKTLLRASASPPAASETLLRPRRADERDRAQRTPAPGGKGERCGGGGRMNSLPQRHKVRLRGLNAIYFLQTNLP